MFLHKIVVRFLATGISVVVKRNNICACSVQICKHDVVSLSTSETGIFKIVCSVKVSRAQPNG